jgi:hypothetical protein
MIEYRLLCRGIDRPAGRVVRRIDHHGARARRQRIEQPLDVEPPAAFAECEWNAHDVRRQDLRDLDQVRPQRRHDDDAIARCDQRFDRQHQRGHPRRRHRHGRIGRRAMQSRHVPRDRRAKLGDAEILRIERLAARERSGRRVANERRRDLIGLAEPEREHVRVMHAGVRDLADLRRAERANFGTRHGVARWSMGQRRAGWRGHARIIGQTAISYRSRPWPFAA